MIASVDIVTEEQVVKALNVAVFRRRAPQVKEPHQILVLPVNISEHLDRCFNFKNHGLFLKDLLAFLSQSDDVLSAESEVAIAVELGRPLSGSQEVVEEELVEGVHGVDGSVRAGGSRRAHSSHLRRVFSLLIVHEGESNHLGTLAVPEVDLGLRDLDLGVVELAAKGRGL